MIFAKPTELYTPQDNSEFPFILFGNSATRSSNPGTVSSVGWNLKLKASGR